MRSKSNSGRCLLPSAQKPGEGASTEGTALSRHTCVGLGAGERSFQKSQPPRSSTLSELIDAHVGTEPFALISDIEGAETSFLIEPEPALGRCTLLIAELHESRADGAPVGPDALCDSIESANGMTLLDVRGPVVAARRFIDEL